MLSIQIDSLGKKFGSEWIFRNLSYEISAGEKIVILGGNGSGKSTLLQVISGFITPNEGSISYKFNNESINEENLRTKVSLASPYLQLIEDFSLVEMIEHAKMFKPFVNDLKPKEIAELTGLVHAEKKLIRQFSSGMKQRLKLALAILADTPLLLLDEAVSNLDAEAILWYKKMIETYATKRTIIVCSNTIKDEYYFCTRELNVSNFKTRK